MSPMWQRLFFVLSVLFALPGGALASNLDQFGVGARGMALGSAVAATTTSWDAAYYNPGGLGMALENTLVGGFSYADYSLKFKTEQRTAKQDNDTERQTPLSAYTLGFSTKLSDDPDDLLARAGFGFLLWTPTRQVFGIEMQTSPGQPQYFLLGGRRDKIAVLPGVGIRILPASATDEGVQLGIGFGVTFLADLKGDFIFDLSNNAVTDVNVHQTLAFDMSPNVGLYCMPTPWLSLGLVYRGKLSLKADIAVVIDLDGDGVGDFPLDMEAVALFQPDQIVAGMAIDPIDHLTLSFDLTFQRWSAFKDPFSTIAPIIGQTDPHFKDVVIPRFGLEYWASEAVALRAGYYFQPSPIPDQHGATNLIELDKHVFSLGAGYTIWRYVEVFERMGNTIVAIEKEQRPVSVDIFLQWHAHENVTVHKNDPNTSGGVGNFYRAGGSIWNAGMQVTFRF